MTPAVANGIPMQMVRPDGSVANRAFDPPVLTASVNGLPIVLSAPLTLGGTPAVAVPVTMTLINGIPIVPVGAVVTCTDGYVGTVLPQHGAGPLIDFM